MRKTRTLHKPVKRVAPNIPKSKAALRGDSTVTVQHFSELGHYR
jgi:hypothetical protein